MWRPLNCIYATTHNQEKITQIDTYYYKKYTHVLIDSLWPNWARKHTITHANTQNTYMCGQVTTTLVCIRLCLVLSFHLLLTAMKQDSAVDTRATVTNLTSSYIASNRSPWSSQRVDMHQLICFIISPNSAIFCVNVFTWVGRSEIIYTSVWLCVCNIVNIRRSSYSISTHT